MNTLNGKSRYLPIFSNYNIENGEKGELNMKKQKIIPSLLMMGLIMAVSPSIFSVSASSGYGGGSGTESDPYLISTPEHLNQLQLDVNVNKIDTSGKYYQLVNDIDLTNFDSDDNESNGNFTPIGYRNDSTDYGYFKGTFDGNGNTISNLEIILPEQNYVGLFGYNYCANVRNVGVENVLVEGKTYVGGLVGYQYNGAITQSYVVGNVTGSSDYVGGLVGYQYYGAINQSNATGNVSGNYNIAGLVGYQNRGTIAQSYATGDVAGVDCIGGLVGGQSGTISQSYATGEVNGSSKYVGGLVGSQSGGTISQSYATGNVSKSDYYSYVGGLIGFQADSSSKISQSYATGGGKRKW